MKYLTSSILSVILFSNSAVLAQGLFVFSGGSKGVWDCWSQSTPRLASTNNVAFLWGSGTTLVSGIMPSVATNNTTSFSFATAWSDILSDSGYTLAVDTNANAIVITRCANGGSWSYNSSQSFPVAGTSASGGSTTVFVIGWNCNYATPQAAQTAGAAVGWSAPFAYTYAAASPPGTPTDFLSAGLQPFGVGAVPEPSTFALAGLGAAALMIFRRKK